MKILFIRPLAALVVSLLVLQVTAQAQPPKKAVSASVPASQPFAFSAAPSSQLTKLREVEGVTEYALPNGLTILLAPDNSKPTTTVNMVYRVGSRHEGYGETGAAHLLEHMLFKATDRIADPKKEMTQRGARWNGTTTFDRTNYFAQFAYDEETLAWMLGWLADAMTHAKVSRADLDSEMTVVRNEMERAENNPGRILGERMRRAAYDWHGYGHSVIGARSDVENIPIERLQAFYRKYYRPDNAVLVITGKFDDAAVQKAVATQFSRIAKPSTALEGTWTMESVQDGERHVALRRIGGAPSVAALYRSVPATQREYAAASVLAQLLNYESTALGKNLVNTGMAVTHWAHASSTAEPGFFMAGIGLPDSKTPQEQDLAASKALAALTQQLENLSFNKAQMLVSQTEVLQKIQRTLRDPETLGLALTESIAMGDWRLLFASRDWVESLTFEEVQLFAKRYFVASNRTTGAYLPTELASNRAPSPERVNVAELLRDYKGKPNAASTEEFVATPENIEAKLVKSQITVGGKPGLKLAVLPRPTKDNRVNGTLRLHWGTLENLNLNKNPSPVYLASYLGPMLKQGTDSKNADKIGQALLALDARLNFNASINELTVNFELPAANWPAFIELLAELLQKSNFPDAKFERIQKEAVASISTLKADTASVAGLALQRSFAQYPTAGDPRIVRNLDEAESLLRSASASQLRTLWAKFGGASNGEIALVGPLQAAEVHSSLEKHFGNWASREPYKLLIFENPARIETPWQQIKLAEKANANYAARIPLAMNDNDPDYPALWIGVQMLGGRAGTALWNRIREKEGLSYGVNAGLAVPNVDRTAITATSKDDKDSKPAANEKNSEVQAAYITLSASFAPENQAKLRKSIRDELSQRASNGFDEQELANTRNAVVKSRADYLAQPANVVASLAQQLRYGSDMKRYSELTAQYQKMDLPFVNAALKKYLLVDRLVEVAAGTFKD